MIRINLLPAEDAARAAGRRHDLALGVLVLAMATFGLIVAHTWQRARVVVAEREQRRITQELVAIQGPYADVTRMEQQKQELREKLRVIAELEARKVGPVRLLEDLSGATPDKLWLLEFADTGGAVKISGLGVDEQTVADFLRRLASSPYFRRIDLEETSQVDQDGIKHKKFVISGEIDYTGGGPRGATEASAARPGKGPGAGR
ncbi:MAG: PilN domain-containing protein [Deltaproteobacteria bacterium]|nr:MAG: PilN domain-containing protein [Deltaproteobacteria bacterium]TMA66001.1 MAG: PilN domain-containing protein [Deltaproteobacteria bacterium]TMB40797.1 MAG: PilN domain-containing protein [Deltaproteobacteria bacterium]